MRGWSRCLSGGSANCRPHPSKTPPDPRDSSTAAVSYSERPFFCRASVRRNAECWGLMCRRESCPHGRATAMMTHGGPPMVTYRQAAGRGQTWSLALKLGRWGRSRKRTRDRGSTTSIRTSLLSLRKRLAFPFPLPMWFLLKGNRRACSLRRSRNPQCTVQPSRSLPVPVSRSLQVEQEPSALLTRQETDPTFLLLLQHRQLKHPGLHRLLV